MQDLPEPHRPVQAPRGGGDKAPSFDLEVGQTLAIVGEAGSGKSTLARILAGMIEPSGGEIAIEGNPWSTAITRPAASCCG